MCGELNGQPAPAPPPAACQEGRALQHTSSVSSVGSASISFSCCKPILKPVSKDYFSEYYVYRGRGLPPGAPSGGGCVIPVLWEREGPQAAPSLQSGLAGPIRGGIGQDYF